jgi:hypothetical protein
MNGSNEEENFIINRIILKESNIKKLTSQYLDFMNKFNNLTRNEMGNLLDQIINEIDLIEINLLKAENIQKLKIYDQKYLNNISKKIDENILQTKNEIQNYKKQLQESKEDKSYKIHCEEIAKQINEYDNTEILKDKITKVEEENKKILHKSKMIDNRIENDSNKISLLVSLVKDLKNGLDKDINNIILEQEEKEKNNLLNNDMMIDDK